VLHEQLTDDHGRVGPGAEWSFRLVDLGEYGQRLERTNALMLMLMEVLQRRLAGAALSPTRRRQCAYGQGNVG
jgi:hypothetical protein